MQVDSECKENTTKAHYPVSVPRPSSIPTFSEVSPTLTEEKTEGSPMETTQGASEHALTDVIKERDSLQAQLQQIQAQQEFNRHQMNRLNLELRTANDE